MKRKEDRSTFIRPHEGLFGLREWLEEGVNFRVSEFLEAKAPRDCALAEGALLVDWVAAASFALAPTRLSGVFQSWTLASQ